MSESVRTTSERIPITGYGDEARADGLRRMKRRATGLLVLSAIVFIVARIFQDDQDWLHYVAAAAEGSMVGGLADWFAVTALFRHPMGIPVPHTALIPSRKDQLGRAIGDFVEDNFLTGPVVMEKLRAGRITERAADWAAQPKNAQLVARHSSAALAGVAQVLRDDRVQIAIERSLDSWVRKVPLAPLAGRALAVATQDGRHTEMVDAALGGAIRFLGDHREDLRQRFGKESPWWVPEAIDDRIFNKLYDGIQIFVREVAGKPDHEFRAYLDQRLEELIDRLQNDPDLIARGEEIKTQLLSHPAVRTWTASLWTDFKGMLQKQARDPSSVLRTQIAEEVQAIAATVAEEPELQAKIDGWIEAAVVYLLEEHRHQAGDLIATTVERWDPNDAADRVELAVGRDLQFIRINGTVVGGLAGLAIFSISRIFL